MPHRCGWLGRWRCGWLGRWLGLERRPTRANYLDIEIFRRTPSLSSLISRYCYITRTSAGPHSCERGGSATMTANSFGSRAALQVAGEQYQIYRLDAAHGPDT